MMRNFRSLLLLLLLVAWSGPARAESPTLDPPLRILMGAGRSVSSVLSAVANPQDRTVIPRLFQTGTPAEAPEMIEVFLESGNNELPNVPGEIQLKHVGGGLFAGRVSLRGLGKLLESGVVKSARLSRPVRATLDQSIPYLGLHRVRSVDLTSGMFEGFTGRGVVLGVVDTGLDSHHPDFSKPDGSTRIFRFWDQWDPFGVAPVGFSYGSEIRESGINSGVFETLDLIGHGTHVTGIAAGTGLGSFKPGEGVSFAGVAPEATVIGVRTNFTEVGVVHGTHYIFDRAELLGYPTVLNLSLGNHFGPHRGNTVFELALEEAVGPGALIVAAAGNDGHRDMHAEMVLLEGESKTLSFDFPPYTPDPEGFTFVDIEGWFHIDNRYRFTVVSPLGNEVGSFVFGDLTVAYEDIKGMVRGWYTEDYEMGTLLLEVEHNRNSVRHAVGEWKVRVEALTVKGDPALDFWMVSWSGLRDGGIPEFTAFQNRGESIVSPATAKKILAVGAVSTRGCWTNSTGEERCYPTPPDIGEVAAFSSLGPSSDGRKKPEVLAPGYGVVAARSSRISAFSIDPAVLEDLSTPDGLYFLNQGTSMSAPHVAGTVALLLEKYPRMTFDQMVQRLSLRADQLRDWRTGETVLTVQTGEALAPMVSGVLSELVTEPEGVRILWYAGKPRTPVRYRVYKGFSDEGPFHALDDRGIVGDSPYQLLDRNVEPGRKHVYRLVVVDETGLEDDLDTLRTQTPGVPRVQFRPPFPNPARNTVRLDFYLPPTPEGGHFRLDAFDLQGKLVAEIDEGMYPPEGGDLQSQWNRTDQAGRRVGGGVYFVRLAYGPDAGADGDNPEILGTRVRRVVVLD